MWGKGTDLLRCTKEPISQRLLLHEVAQEHLETYERGLDEEV